MRSHCLMAERPKSEIDPGSDLLFGLRDLVTPTGLAAPLHDQAGSMGQIKADEVAAIPMLQLKTPGSTKRQAGNHWVRTEDRLIIAVPAHAVLAVAIEIEEDAVERQRDDLFDHILQNIQSRGQGRRLMPNAAIGISAVAVPGGQPRQRDFPPEECRRFLAPIDRVQEVRACQIRPIGRYGILDQKNLAVAR